MLLTTTQSGLFRMMIATWSPFLQPYSLTSMFATMTARLCAWEVGVREIGKSVCKHRQPPATTTVGELCDA